MSGAKLQGYERKTRAFLHTAKGQKVYNNARGLGWTREAALCAVAQTATSIVTYERLAAIVDSIVHEPNQYRMV